jgi:L-threonylcarbamoyladenylate synthase
LAEGYEEKGVGIAIMNRLNKAAGFDIIKVWFSYCDIYF